MDLQQKIGAICTEASYYIEALKRATSDGQDHISPDFVRFYIEKIENNLKEIQETC